MNIKIKQTKYEPIPQGIYPGTIKSIEAEDREFGPQLKFKLLLDPFEGYDSGKELQTWCSAKFSPKSKLYEWTSTLLGKIAPDYEFNSDDLLNKRVLVVVGHKAGNDGNEYDKIEKIMPLRQQKTLSDLNRELEYFESEVPA